MKKLLRFVGLFTLLALTGAEGVQAEGFSMWLGDASGNHISTINKAYGETFSVYIWMATSIDTWYAEAAVGFDSTSIEGSAAKPNDGKIVLATGNTDDDLIWGDALGLYPTSFSKGLNGFYNAAGGSRPFGADFACAQMSGNVAPVTTPVLFSTMNLMSKLQSGESYTISLWNDGSDTAGGLNTMILDADSNAIYGTSDSLTVTSVVPEPSSMLVLLFGIVGAVLLGYFAPARKICKRSDSA